MAAKPGEVVIRIADDNDIDVIADLVNADRVLGQPKCRADDVRRAMVGAAEMERAWWDAFVNLTTIVATDGTSLLGAASCAVQGTERIGYILWLHAREEPAIVDMLLDELVRRLEPEKCVRAFWIATPLTLGMDALPARHRPETHAALVRRDFAGTDAWLYMVGRPVLQAPDGVAIRTTGTNEWELSIRDPSDGAIGTATVELGREQIGIVWWLEVKPAYRGRAYGRALLLQAMRLLGSVGAERIILYVDHGDPSSRDRRPAINLYESVGFQTVDHLWSYELLR